jgi:EAL domain-containing protein (putative c-di-GMP-specific phosphodiesterase class I)
METDLRAALGAKQFHLVFQPLIKAKDQKLIGFEALIRWNHPKRGLVPPNVFIPVAEEIGLMAAIGEWVIDEACKAAASWPENISVALNVSPKQISCRRSPIQSARRSHATVCRGTASNWK